MAIKDWGYAVPPVSGYEKVFDNKITSERLFIAKNKTKITPSQKNWNYSYTVYIDGRPSRGFSTKSQALRYAKEYMGKH